MSVPMLFILLFFCILTKLRSAFIVGSLFFIVSAFMLLEKVFLPLYTGAYAETSETEDGQPKQLASTSNGG